MSGPRGAVAGVGRVDVPNAVRGASTGFSVLLVGGLVAPMTTLVSVPFARVWLTSVAVLAFAVAARRSRLASAPALHGAVAAVLSYLLVLPLLLPFPEARHPLQIGLTLATALVVGAVTGVIAPRLTTPGGSS